MIVTDHAEILAQALDRTAARYVFPERAEELDRTLRSRLAAGAYEGLSGPEFCEKVTADMHEVCSDGHLRLLWSDEPQSTTAPEDAAAARAAFVALLREKNQGVHRVEHLDGNVGLLDVRLIADSQSGAAAIGAAMQLVSDTTALLLDLRECHGGATEGAAMWCSYFFPDDQVHLNDIYDRPTGTTRQHWTASHLPGPRYLNRPVYVLTGAGTFSGGEDVAYTLQAHGRAVVVGETTGGGAHPTGRHALTEHITVTVPYQRTTSAVTGTNWEGTGVTPDLPCPAAEALPTAYQDALHRTPA